MFWLHYIGGSESHPWLILNNGGTQTVWKDPVRPMTDKTIPFAGQTRWHAGPGRGDNVLGNWVCRVRTMHTLHTWDHKVKLYQPPRSPLDMCCCIEWIWYTGRVARCAIWLVALAPIRVVSHSERLVLPQNLLTVDNCLSTRLWSNTWVTSHKYQPINHQFEANQNQSDNLNVLGEF